MKFLPESYVNIFKTLTHMLLVLHWGLSNCLRPLWDSFHAFNIKITYTPYILMLTSTLEVTQKHACHSYQNTPSLWHDSSCCKNSMGYAKEKQKKNIRAQKHGKKKEKKKKDSPYLKIKYRVMQKGVRVPSRKFHTHAHLDLIVWPVFSIGSGF